MKIIKIIPRSYCHGVVEAINLTIDAILNKKTPRPIHLLGELVHNKHINNVFKNNDIIIHESKNKTRLELLEEIPDQNGTVILTAHGVSDLVIKRAQEKNLNIINATCFDVTKTFNLIKTKIAQNYEIIYIGKKNHPESMAASELDLNHVHLVESIDDVNKLKLKTKNIIITNQTTLSLWDVAVVADYILDLYPSSIYEREICLATQTRQEAVVKTAAEVDLIIIVGDPKSNNSNKLVEVSEKIAKTKAILIEDASDLFDFDFTNIKKIGVSAGASTPPLLVKDVVTYLENIETYDKKNYQIDNDKLIPKLKKSKLEN